MGGGIGVFAEVRDGDLPDASLETLCEGRRLADRRPGVPLCAVVLGSRASALAAIAVAHGADRVFWAEEPRFSRYAPEPFTAAIAELIRREEPSVFLFAATDTGGDLAARVAAKLRAGLFPRCDRLEISDDGLLTATRLTHGRKAHTTARYRNTRLQMATVEPGIAKIRPAASPGGRVPPEIVRFRPEERGGERITMAGVIAADPKTVDIADAEILVAGGKGACGGDGFRLVRELAEALGASVAGSRAAVDDGCLPRDRQIGQSGKSVSPRLLISCGISGAHAHVAGLREARTIVAINTDRNAPLLKLADLAVVGDLREILPLLTDRLKNV